MKTCGECIFYKQIAPNCKEGICECPLPWWVLIELGDTTMCSDDAQDCVCFKERGEDDKNL